MNKKLLLVDMDHVVCDYQKADIAAKIREPKVLFPQGRCGFFLNMEPFPGSIESIQILQDSYEILFLTRPSVFNPISYTEKRLWIEKWLGYEYCYNLILCYDKTLVRGDYLIDDHIHQYTGDKKGRMEPVWELLHFGSPKYPDWKSITEKLIS